MRRPPIIYSDDEMLWLEANRMMVISDYHRAFVAEFGRGDVSAQHLHSLRKRKGWKTGRTGQFDKGHVPWTAGRKLPYNAGTARTQFKKGQIPHTYRGPGHESVDKDGYVWIIIDEVNPWTGASTRRIHKHRWLWEQKHGPVPDGFALKCLGDKSNTDPSNWKLIPKGMLPRLNGKSGRDFDHAPAELKPTIMAVAELEHASRRSR